MHQIIEHERVMLWLGAAQTQHNHNITDDAKKETEIYSKG